MVEPEFWREVSIIFVRGRSRSPAVGALVGAAMRVRWLGHPALALDAATVKADQEPAETA